MTVHQLGEFTVKDGRKFKVEVDTTEYDNGWESPDRFRFNLYEWDEETKSWLFDTFPRETYIVEPEWRDD